MSVKAVFFDIDGTLVSFKTHRMPQSAIEALKQLRANGTKIFIATGRPTQFIDNLSSKVKFDGMITVNGSYCLTGEGEVIHKNIIPRGDIENLIKWHKQNPVPFMFVNEETIFTTGIDADVKYITEHLDIDMPPTLPIEEALKHENIQMMGYFPKEEDDKYLTEILPNCDAMRWHPLFTDIIAKGSNKSAGINKILEYYQIPLENTMAFGDGGNDIPMLKHVAISIAMGNAADTVKQVADYVTSSVDEDGIYNGLKHFGLI